MPSNRKLGPACQGQEELCEPYFLCIQTISVESFPISAPLLSYNGSQFRACCSSSNSSGLCPGSVLFESRSHGWTSTVLTGRFPWFSSPNLGKEWDCGPNEVTNETLCRFEFIINHFLITLQFEISTLSYIHQNFTKNLCVLN